MSSLGLVPVFMIGLLGSVHCIGMCGGIVGALSVASGRRKPFPVAVVNSTAIVPNVPTISSAAFEDVVRVVSYNTGRLASYATAGAIAGGVAQGARSFASLASIQIGGYWLANLMLVALGLYLMNAWSGLTRLEAVGQVVWRRVQPLTKHFLPMDTPVKALAMGALWGWIPCGMVYSVLLTAMLTGSSLAGAAVMLAFGAGTLPVLLTMGMLGSRLQMWTRRRGVRIASGLIILGFGLLGLARASSGVSLGWLDAVCITPPALESSSGGHQ